MNAILPSASLPAFVLACTPSLALLFRAFVAGDLAADSFDEVWDALSDPDAYRPAVEVEDWLRQNWAAILPPRPAPVEEAQVSTLSTPPTHARLWMPAFLRAIATGATAKEAAAAAGIERTTAYRARERDTTFAQAWTASGNEAADLVRAEVRRRAIEGWEEPVFGAGAPGVGTVQVGTIRRFDSGLLAKMALAYCEEYRPAGATTNVNVNATATAAAGAASSVTITPEKLADLQARVRARMVRHMERVRSFDTPPAAPNAE